MPTENEIALKKLEKLEFNIPDNDAVILPKQKDFFADYVPPMEKINGNTLANEIKEKNEKKVTSTTTDSPEPKDNIQLPNEKIAASLDNLTKGIGDVISGAHADDGTDIGASSDSKPVRSTAKNDIVDYLIDKIENGGFQPYSEYDEEKQTLREYLEGLPKKDLHGLVDANYGTKENSAKEQYRQEFKEALPTHLKYVVDALIDGNTPARDIYSALARVEQTTALDPSKENDQILIVQNYLQTKEFGSLEAIEEQVAEWKETGKIEKKAKEFKPLLDKLQEEQLAVYAAQNEETNRQRAESAKWYHDSIVNVLKTKDLGSIKLGNKEQSALYESMLVNMKPSQFTGELQDTLMQKIEEIKYIKPDFKALAKMHLFAQDMEAYDKMMKQQGANEATGVIVKELKTNQGSGNGGGGATIPTPQVKRTESARNNEPRAAKQKVSPLDRVW